MSENKQAPAQEDQAFNKAAYPEPPKPPYDTPSNRRNYHVQEDGSYTAITKRFKLADLFKGIKLLMSLRVDQTLLGHLWKFFTLVFKISPLRVTLQLLGRTLERLAPLATQHFTSQLMAQAYTVVETGNVNRKQVIFNSVLRILVPLVTLRISKWTQENEAALGFKFDAMIKTRLNEVRCGLDIYSQDGRPLVKDQFRLVHMLLQYKKPQRLLNESFGVIADFTAILTSASIILRVLTRKNRNHSFIALALIVGGSKNILSLWNKRELVERTDPSWEQMESTYIMANRFDENRNELKLLGLQRVFTERFKNLANSLGFSMIEPEKYTLGSIPQALEAFMAPVMIATYIWRAQNSLTRNNLPKIPELEFLRTTAEELSGRVRCLFEDYQKVANQADSIKAFFEIQDVKPLVEEPEHPVPFKSTHQENQGMEIEFKDVSFKYPDTGVNVLKHINLKIKPGQLVALVGDNGAGKSTLINVLTRLYDATEGEILLNNTPIKSFHTTDLHAQMVVLFQNTGKLYVPIKDFISVGSAQMDMNQVKEAAKQAGCHEFIMKTYAGYDSWVNRMDEGGRTTEQMLRRFMHRDYKQETGEDNESWHAYDRYPPQEVSFSGGQWQKLALARAFYIKNASLRVYDEFSKELDSIAERDAFRQIWKTREQTNSTVLYVTHKYTSVPWADLILCMKDGELIESGTHAELIALRGHYFKLYDIAASGLNKDESYIFDDVVDVKPEATLN